MDIPKCCGVCIHCDSVYEDDIDEVDEYYAQHKCELGNDNFNYNNGICENFE